MVTGRVVLKLAPCHLECSSCDQSLHGSTQSGAICVQATFTSSYLHTCVIFVALLIFMFSVYSTNHYLGSPSKVYDNLQAVAERYPVGGNRGGSYLTFWSIDGLKFGILQAVSCWGSACRHPCNVAPDQVIRLAACLRHASQGCGQVLKEPHCWHVIKKQQARLKVHFLDCAWLADAPQVDMLSVCLPSGFFQWARWAKLAYVALRSHHCGPGILAVGNCSPALSSLQGLHNWRPAVVSSRTLLVCCPNPKKLIAACFQAR